MAKKSDFACVAASDLGALELSLSTLALDELADLPADTFKQSEHRGAWLADLRAEELHHAQKPAGTDDRKAKRAVQAFLRRRRRPWEVRVVDNVRNPRGSPGAPNPARKPNAVRECDATIDLDPFLQQPRRGHVHLRAAEHVRLGIHAPAHSHDPVEAFANRLENPWHGLRQRRRFHEHPCRHVLRSEMTFARLPDAVGSRK